MNHITVRNTEKNDRELVAESFSKHHIEYTLVEVKMIEQKKIKSCLFLLQTFILILLLILISSNTVFAYPSEYFLNVEKIAQKQTTQTGWIRCGGCPAGKIGCQWCWAASYASAIRYQTTWDTILASGVCQVVEGSIICMGETAADIIDDVDPFFGTSSTLYSGDPSASTIRSSIYNGHDPIFLGDMGKQHSFMAILMKVLTSMFA
jgi:hypothetical protein